MLSAPRVAHAHGIGGRLDLPVPVSYFVVAAGLVIVISFVALSILWPEPRLQDGPLNRPLGTWPRLAGVLLAALGLAGLLAVLSQIVPELFGLERQQGRPTIAPVLLWVVLWLVVPFSSALVGNWYAALNPWRTLGSWLPADTGRSFRELGVWPASFALLTFAWFELIFPGAGEPGALGWIALAYTIYLAAAIVLLGRDRGLLAADLFTTYNRMFSAIAPWGRRSDGVVIWRGWLRALPVLPEWPGFTFFVLAAIGTVTYDGASGTAWFRNVAGDLTTTLPGQTLLLLGTVALVSAGYWFASWVAARMVGGTSARVVGDRFAHTLVPIALAYAVAHYMTLIFFEGQQLFSAISDPFGLGWDAFGTADRTVDFFITASEPIWYAQLVAIVGGHVLGVVLAHDRALADFGPNAVRSQYAMLLLMVALTSLGLVVLAG